MFDWRIENSPEYEKEMAERRSERDREDAAKKSERADAVARTWKDGVPWQDIETLPFAAYADAYGYEGSVIVTDGSDVALVSVKERFGTPVFWKTPPKRVCRDGVFFLEGGEKYTPDRPDWWWEWELIDEHGMMNYAGGEEIGKDEIDFIPDRWMPLP